MLTNLEVLFMFCCIRNIFGIFRENLSFFVLPYFRDFRQKWQRKKTRKTRIHFIVKHVTLDAVIIVTTIDT